MPTDIPVSGPLSWLASRLGLNDPGVNINGACASSTMAVARAAAMIASGRADAVLVVCMDLVSEFVFSGFVRCRRWIPPVAAPSTGTATAFPSAREGRPC